MTKLKAIVNKLSLHDVLLELSIFYMLNILESDVNHSQVVTNQSFSKLDMANSKMSFLKTVNGFRYNLSEINNVIHLYVYLFVRVRGFSFIRSLGTLFHHSRTYFSLVCSLSVNNLECFRFGFHCWLELTFHEARSDF